MSDAPIVIVGAPRSGTSLLQKVLRECPGFGSAPREGQHIWGPWVHPERSDWIGECVAPGVLGDADTINSIRSQFDADALSATQWRRVSGSGLLNIALVKRLARLLPRPFVKALSTAGTSAEHFRLVEKSVHAGLWLPLVDAVFPTARFIHLVRDPARVVPSIMAGWLDGGRFVSFRTPEPLSIAGYDGNAHDWCFPLPPGWQEVRNSSLLDVACFQWRAINEAVSAFFDADGRRDRCLTVRLEDLIRDPGPTLDAIRKHADISELGYFDAFRTKLPVVNEGNPGGRRPTVDLADIRRRTSDVAALLGYEV